MLVLPAWIFNKMPIQGLVADGQCYVQVKIDILQVLVRTNLAPKDRCQRHSKFVGAQNLEKIVSI